MCEVVGDENMLFMWEIATDLPDDRVAISLLREAAQEWFTIRGFPVASHLLEQYKRATKRILKDQKHTKRVTLERRKHVDLITATFNIIIIFTCFNAFCYAYNHF